jgi:hypothetical protein
MEFTSDTVVAKVRGKLLSAFRTHSDSTFIIEGDSWTVKEEFREIFWSYVI